MAASIESADALTASIFPSSGKIVTAFLISVAALMIASKLVLDRIGALDKNEPPLLRPRVPICGHLFGILRWQVGYFQMLSSKVPSYPAFTLRVFSRRIYVICEPSLIQAAYRNTRAFDFGSFVVESSQRAFDIGEQGMKIIRGETSPDYNPNGSFLNGNSGRSYLNENHKIMVESLSPGAGLDELNRGVLKRVAASLNTISGTGEVFSLYRWIRDILTLATAETLYGPQSPLSDDRGLIDCLWDFEENMTLLMLNFLPRLIAPKAYQGRLRIKSAFKAFYSDKHNLTASKLVQSRLACAQKWGFTPDDIANFEISTLFLATTNSVPTTFWQLSYILSSPHVFEQIRKEVESIVTRELGKEDGRAEAVIDITLFQNHCPLLMSSLDETLRLVDAATSVRSVVQPTILKSPVSSFSYDLKSPAVIQLPSGITHTSPKIWGPDAASFNPSRFLPSAKATLSKAELQAQKQGYFPFGGGKHLCPGRHFAKMEILAFVAGVVVGFDVDNQTGEDFKVPDMAFQKLGTAVKKPVRDVAVRIRRRHGWEDVRWRFASIGDGAVDLKAFEDDGE
ncbi:unnamed protein product [Diplocarpon coronariae]|nr:hypothetical protein JHW43_006791 [Diplocarpon mali]